MKANKTTVAKDPAVLAAKAAEYKATIPTEILAKYQDKLVTHVTVAMSKVGGVHTEKPEKPVAFDYAINYLTNAPKFGFHVASLYFVDGSELVFRKNGFEKEK